MQETRTSNRSLVYAHAASPTQVLAGVKHLDITLDRCWRLITQPSQVRMWFGDLSADLARSTTARLDFGDGDFFTIEDVSIEPGEVMEYSWRFLDVGDSTRIIWRISGEDGDACVELTDTNAKRSQDGTEELRTGWLDFLERLDKYVATGEVTRYDFRHDFEGSIELDLPFPAALMSIAKAGGMLALAAPVTDTGSQGDSSQHVGPITYSSENCVSFDLSETGWANATHCEVQLRDKAPKAAFFVQQTGWDTISPNPETCIAKRSSYSFLWRTALETAKRTIEDGAASVEKT